MTSISKNMSINKLDDIVRKYNNTCHSTIKMKPADVKSNIYIDFDNKNSKEDPKLKIGDHVRISKCKNIFVKDYFRSWSEEVFVIKKVKNTVSWPYVISNLNFEGTVGTFFGKVLQKTNQKKSLELKK